MEQPLSENGPTLTRRLLQWIPVCLILCTAVWCYYAYTYEFCINIVANCIQRLIYLIVFHFLLLSYFLAYYRAITKGIATTPDIFALPPEILEELRATQDEASHNAVLDEFVKQRNLPVLLRKQTGSYIYCDKCLAIKPDRAHHCSICKRCVMKMDHHCPWLNTCVCFSNYKFFLLLLFYGLMLCIFTFLSIFPFYIMFFIGQNDLGGNPKSNTLSRLSVLFLFFMSGMFAMPVIGMVYDHVYLIARNQTTIETLQKLKFVDGASENAYDLGIAKNFREVFGQHWYLWFIPIFSTLGDGVIYTRKNVNIA